MGGTLPYMATEQFAPGGADQRSRSVGGRRHALRAARRTSPGAAADAGGAARGTPTAPDAPYAAHRRRGAGPAAPLARLDRPLPAETQGAAHRDARGMLAELEPLLPGARRCTLGPDTGPYPGLAAFQEDDADRFFGRERRRPAAGTRLREHPRRRHRRRLGRGQVVVRARGRGARAQRVGRELGGLVLRPGRQPLQGSGDDAAHADRQHGVAGRAGGAPAARGQLAGEPPATWAPCCARGRRPGSRSAAVRRPVRGALHAGARRGGTTRVHGLPIGRRRRRRRAVARARLDALRLPRPARRGSTLPR